MAKRNAEVVLQYSTLYPFRLRGQKLMCAYCCDQFEDPVEFRRHIDETHKDVDIYKAFAHKRNRGGRDYLKVDSVNLKCRLCKEPFNTVAEITKHLTDHQKNEGIQDIDLNYEVGLHPYRLIKDKLLCLVCNMKQPTLTKLTRHMSSHFTNYACDVCDKSYLNIESLKFHRKVSHLENHVCRKCMMEFSTSEERKEHMKMSSKCWGFSCIHCKERFLSWERKQAHLVSKHNVEALKYPCSECGAVLKSRLSFSYHYNKTHSDLAHMCSYCGLKFGSKGVLEHHMLIHTREKQFECTICSKSLISEKALKNHMKKHSDKNKLSTQFKAKG